MSAPDPVKVLFLGANPRTTTPLALDEEVRSITEKIRLAEGRDLIRVVQAHAVRPDDLLQQLNQHQPHIVHFSGHGSEEGEIILVDGQGQAKPVSAAALKALFTTLKDNIRVVVLNACYSQVQGAAIAEAIDVVVGMGDAIGDEAAITFAASFYRALGFSRSVQAAFDQAHAALLLEGIPEEDTPQLLVRPGVEAASIVLVDEQARPQAGEGGQRGVSQYAHGTGIAQATHGGSAGVQMGQPRRPGPPRTS
jgi:hypothetical protein